MQKHKMALDINDDDDETFGLFPSSKETNEGLEAKQRGRKVLNLTGDNFVSEAADQLWSRTSGKFKSTANGQGSFVGIILPDSATMIEIVVTGTFTGVWNLTRDGTIIASAAAGVVDKSITTPVIDNNFRYSIDVNVENDEQIFQAKITYVE